MDRPERPGPAANQCGQGAGNAGLVLGLGAHAHLCGRHRRVAMAVQPDRRLGRQLVRAAPRARRDGLQPARATPAGRARRSALGRLLAAQYLGHRGHRVAEIGSAHV
ncbi:hypothetical protein G6F22_019769 [Rhizopus arrhizus]|nr:hypothetical protein G6F22_019769 [Rhizopus arrhizus]